MSNTKTPKQVLSSLLLGAAREAELWATNLSLNTFPDTSWDDPAVQKHPAVIGGWRWENWDELQNDCNRWAWLADTAADCPEVQEGECLDFCVQGGFQGGSQSRLSFVYRGLKINDQRLRGTLSRRQKCAKRHAEGSIIPCIIPSRW